MGTSLVPMAFLPSHKLSRQTFPVPLSQDIPLAFTVALWATLCLAWPVPDSPSTLSNMAHNAHTLFLVSTGFKVTLRHPTYTIALAEIFKGTVSHLWA